MLASYPVRRGIAVLVLALVVLGLLALRLRSGPTSEGYRSAMAAAPEDRLYVAEPGRGLLSVGPGGDRRRLGSLPEGAPLALAADGTRLLLGTDSGAYLSDDAGAHWRRAPGVSGRHFLAVALSGGEAAAGAWAEGLWTSSDSGASWRRATLPEGDTELESISLSEGGTDLAATELGVLRSTDGGRTWTRAAGLPDRMTAVDHLGSQLYAADWRGGMFQSSGDGAEWHRVAKVPGGAWVVSGAALALGTTTGLFVAGARASEPLGSREVNNFVMSGSAFFASTAGGGLYASTDGGGHWRLVLER